MPAGCAQDWRADLEFKVTHVEDHQIAPSEPKTKMVTVELMDKLPEDALVEFKGFSETLDKFPADVEVGDEVTCRVEQSRPAGIQTNPSGKGKLSNCRMA